MNCADDLQPLQADPLATHRPGLFGRLAEDVRAAMDRDPAAKNAFVVIVSYAGLHAIWAHRVEHSLWKAGLHSLARVLAQITRFFTGVEIHPGAVFGRRVFIDHGMGIVIGETSIIGDDVTIYHGVTLGGVNMEDIKRHPTIEDGVVIGAGAKVLGDITVGYSSRIGSNAVVVKDVPPQSVVVGVPGHVIRRRKEVGAHVPDLAHSQQPDAIVESLQDVMSRLAALEAHIGISAPEFTGIHLESDGSWDYDGPPQDYVI